MTPAQRRLWNRLQRQAAGLEPRIRKAMLAAFDAVRDLLPEAELARMIDGGTFEALVTDAALDPALAPLRTALQQSVADSTLYFGKDIAAGISFNYLNPRVLDALRRLDSRAIGTLQAAIREGVRAQVQAGLQAGVNPRTIARGIRESVGLPENLARAVAKFRAELETGDRAALSRVLSRGGMYGAKGEWIPNRYHAAGEGLSLRDMRQLNRKLGTEPLKAEQIDRMVGAYRDRLAAWNSETVSRTLARQAQSEGQTLAWRDAIDKGYVDGTALYDRWVGVKDDRERPEHLEMEGEVVPFGETFSNGLRPGEDWNCRCIAQTFADRRRAEAA